MSAATTSSMTTFSESDGWSSSQSTASSNHHRRRHSIDVDGDHMRAKYLQCLGFDVSKPSDAADGVTEISDSAPDASQHEKALPPNTSDAPPVLSRSLDDSRLISFKTKHRNKHERLILLRTSERYTVDLKFDKSYPERCNTPTDDEATANSCSPPTSNKFELSSAWTNFLSSSSPDSCVTASPSSSSAEPLDGAYDLFSLPSDSSMNKPSLDSATELFEFPSGHNDVTTPILLRRESSKSRSEHTSSSWTNQSSLHRPRRKVSFDSTVIATTIPSRYSHSDRIRSRLWSSTNDIYANAIRSEQESMYDGSDWRMATEETDFVCPSSSTSSSPSSIPDQFVQPFHNNNNGMSQSMPTMGCHYEESSIFEPNNFASDLGNDRDEDDAFETGIFTMD